MSENNNIRRLIRLNWFSFTHPDLTVMTYNILAPSYADIDHYPWCSFNDISWSSRKVRIISELKEYKPDIVCLQEVEHFQDFENQVVELGYEQGFYTKRSGWKSDGCEIFWKKSVFREIRRESIELNDIIQELKKKLPEGPHERFKTDNIAQFVILQMVNPPSSLIQSYKDRYIIIANSHLFWDPRYAEVKLVQAYIVANHLQNLVKLFERDLLSRESNLSESEEPKFTITPFFCGDFNSTPDSFVYKYLSQNSSFNRRPNTQPDIIESSTPKYLHNIFTSHVNREYHPSFIDFNYSLSLRFESSYASQSEPDTNYTRNYTGTLDYIWYDQDTLSLCSLLQSVKESEKKRPIEMPNNRYPSDHASLMAQYTFKK